MVKNNFHPNPSIKGNQCGLRLRLLAAAVHLLKLNCVSDWRPATEGQFPLKHVQPTSFKKNITHLHFELPCRQTPGMTTSGGSAPHRHLRMASVEPSTLQSY